LISVPSALISAGASKFSLMAISYACVSMD
jgi:hypothetical protein